MTSATNEITQESSRNISIPTSIGPYTIKEFLGRGAWKCTFRAQRADGTQWALKFYNPTEDAQRIAAARDITEEKYWKKECTNGNNGSDYLASQMLEHHDGFTFLAEELLEDTLEKKLERGWYFKEEEATYIAVRLAKGLAEFHKRYQVPHGDVKPANIGFSREKVKLFDYGTATNHLQGRGADTPYRAPETYSGETLFSCATDIWSYGAILYRILTGKDIEVTKNNRDEINKEVKPQINHNVKNRRLRGLLQKCLQGDEHQRIRDGIELEEEIEEIVRKNEWQYRALSVIKPIMKYLSVALATGIIVGKCQDSVTSSPH